MVAEGEHQAGRMQMVWKQNKKRTRLRPLNTFQLADSDEEGGDFGGSVMDERAGPSVSGDGEHSRVSSRFDFPNGRESRESREEMENSLQSERFLNEGNSLAEEGRFGEALGKWEVAIHLTPGRAILHEQKAQLLLEIGRPWNAVQAATCATELQPTWTEAWVTLARAQLNYGEPSCAVDSAQTALKLQPDHKEANIELERAQYLASRHRQAVRASAALNSYGGDGVPLNVRSSVPSFRRARVYDSRDLSFGVEHHPILERSPKREAEIEKEDDKLDKYDDDTYDWLDELKRPAPQITTENLMSDFSDVL